MVFANVARPGGRLFPPEGPTIRIFLHFDPAAARPISGLSVQSEEYRTGAEDLARLAARDYRDGRVRDAWVTAPAPSFCSSPAERGVTLPS